jgi:hypothetical protein
MWPSIGQGDPYRTSATADCVMSGGGWREPGRQRKRRGGYMDAFTAYPDAPRIAAQLWCLSPPPTRPHGDFDTLRGLLKMAEREGFEPSMGY